MIHLDLRASARAHRPALPETSSAPRAAAIGTWHGRMVNETRSSAVFAALGRQLGHAFGSATLAGACEQFSQEERRHGVLCGAVVEALGGEAVAEMEEGDALPLHEDVAPIEGAIRNLLSVCCLSETVAVALIGAEREDMPDGELRELLTRIWADEIGHSRFGWRLVERHVPSMDRRARARLGAYLRVALRALEAHEIEHLPITNTPEDAALGVCNGRDAQALFYATVTEVILPRLEALGLPAKLAWQTRHASDAPRDRPLARCA